MAAARQTAMEVDSAPEQLEVSASERAALEDTPMLGGEEAVLASAAYEDAESEPTAQAVGDVELPDFSNEEPEAEELVLMEGEEEEPAEDRTAEGEPAENRPAVDPAVAGATEVLASRLLPDTDEAPLEETGASFHCRAQERPWPAGQTPPGGVCPHCMAAGPLCPRPEGKEWFPVIVWCPANLDLSRLDGVRHSIPHFPANIPGGKIDDRYLRLDWISHFSGGGKKQSAASGKGAASAAAPGVASTTPASAAPARRSPASAEPAPGDKRKRTRRGGGASKKEKAKGKGKGSSGAKASASGNVAPAPDPAAAPAAAATAAAGSPTTAKTAAPAKVKGAPAAPPPPAPPAGKGKGSKDKGKGGKDKAEGKDKDAGAGKGEGKVQGKLKSKAKPTDSSRSPAPKKARAIEPAAAAGQPAATAAGVAAGQRILGLVKVRPPSTTLLQFAGVALHWIGVTKHMGTHGLFTIVCWEHECLVHQTDGHSMG